MKLYSESCERNQEPILKILQEVLTKQQYVLEIASGTGQHAVYFGRALPHLSWQTSELTQKHEGILAWLNEIKLPNVLPPVTINVNDVKWPVGIVDAVFNANTVHIISWLEVERMFAGIAHVLNANGILCLYGAFKYKGEFTSESNARFDAYLRSNDRNSGIRDFENINRLAESYGLFLTRDVSMPSYNRALIWQRAQKVLKPL